VGKKGAGMRFRCSPHLFVLDPLLGLFKFDIGGRRFVHQVWWKIKTICQISFIEII
jgi:hypothetical protein